MPQMIKIRHGRFGRIAILNLEGPLVEHAHSYSHLIFLLGGDQFNIMKINGREVPLNQNYGVAINGWEPHSHHKENTSGLFLLFYLNTDWLEQVCMSEDSVKGFKSAAFLLSDEHREKIAHLACVLLAENYVVDIESHIRAIFKASTQSILADESRFQIAKKETRADFRIQKSIEFMQSNLNIRSTFDDVARASGLSRPHFFTLFRKDMEIKPSVFWNTLRMETAIEKLTTTDVSLTELALSLGFSEPGNFSRFFRNHAGVYPRQYRLGLSIEKA